MTTSEWSQVRMWIYKQLAEMGVKEDRAWFDADDFSREVKDANLKDVTAAVRVMVAKGITNLAYARAILVNRGVWTPPRRTPERSRGVDELDDPFAEPDTQ